MVVNNDVIRGAIKIDGNLDVCCFTSWADFVKALPGLLTVEIPADSTNVTVGSQAPSSDQRNIVWIRTDNSGAFLGIYIFTNNGWQQVSPAPNEIVRMYGDSRSVPTGYQLIDLSNSKFSSGEVSAIQATWIRDPTNTYWRVFDVIYSG